MLSFFVFCLDSHGRSHNLEGQINKKILGGELVTKTPSGPRVAALVGPYLSGKTALLESMLAICGATNRKGNAKEGYAIGDGSAESKARNMSTELSVASAEYIDEPWTSYACPGSIHLIQ